VRLDGVLAGRSLTRMVDELIHYTPPCPPEGGNKKNSKAAVQKKRGLANTPANKSVGMTEKRASAGLVRVKLFSVLIFLLLFVSRQN